MHVPSTLPCPYMHFNLSEVAFSYFMFLAPSGGISLSVKKRPQGTEKADPAGMYCI